MAPFAPIKRVLSWKNPTSWWRQGRRLRTFDRIILIWWVPTIQGPVYRTMLTALGRQAPPVIIICHNVLPHESRPGDRQLTQAVLKRAVRLIVHSDSQAALAKQLASTKVQRIELPLIVQLGHRQGSAKQTELRHQLVFFGIVRPYKGVDVLLEALAQVPGVQLTIAGEVWGNDKMYAELVNKLNLQSRVTIQSGYVPAEALGALISQADAVVLPYREGTATWNVALAHAYGKPVIATTAGSLGSQVRDGVDGLLCKPGDAASLAEAIRHFYEPNIAKKLYSNIPKPKTDEQWQAYISAVTKD
jgi:glycosyltransferase involved in cell wall biosynthesis